MHKEQEERIMTITVETLSQENLAWLEHMLRVRFLDGECYEFAVALHEGLGWPMYGLVQHRSDKEPVVRHVVLKSPQYGYFDARGAVVSEHMGEIFDMHPPYPLMPVTREDLERVRPLNTRSIEFARTRAEILWPNLPWKETRAERVAHFLMALEALCYGYGFWIRAPYVTQLPIIEERVGDEAGYVISPTNFGAGFVFDRKLKD